MKRRVISAILCAAALLSMLPVPAMAAGMDNFVRTSSYTDGRFSDVLPDAWYAPHIADVYEYGLMKGTSATEFDPDGYVTMGAAAAMASRLHSIYHTGRSDFVQGSPWYAVYVDYVVANGIVGDGQFADWDAVATRRDFCAIVAHALPQSVLAVTNDVRDIPDVSADDPCAAEIYALYRARVLNGVDEKGTFMPEQPIKRSEVAAVLCRMIALREPSVVPSAVPSTLPTAPPDVDPCPEPTDTPTEQPVVGVSELLAGYQGDMDKRITGLVAYTGRSDRLHNEDYAEYAKYEKVDGAYVVYLDDGSHSLCDVYHPEVKAAFVTEGAQYVNWRISDPTVASIGYGVCHPADGGEGPLGGCLYVTPLKAGRTTITAYTDVSEYSFDLLVPNTTMLGCTSELGRSRVGATVPGCVLPIEATYVNMIGYDDDYATFELKVCFEVPDDFDGPAFSVSFGKGCEPSQVTIDSRDAVGTGYSTTIVKVRRGEPAVYGFSAPPSTR